MQPIIILSVIAIAVIGIGVGSLGNTINLNVQLLGVGDQDLVTPISHANIDFVIEKVQGNENNFKNVIADCIVQADKEIAALSTVYCKLTGARGDVVAEGVTVLQTHLNAGSILTVPIDDPNFVDSQVHNVHDVILVVQSPANDSSPQQPPQD